MNPLVEQLRKSFTDEDYRYAYAESFMNSYVAAQIKVLREQRGLTPEEFAKKLGAKITVVSRLENVGYSAWRVEMLRKMARALGVRLKLTFEEFCTLPDDIECFTREALLRAPFERDPVFSPTVELPSTAALSELTQSQFSEEEFARQATQAYQKAIEARLEDSPNI